MPSAKLALASRRRAAAGRRSPLRCEARPMPQRQPTPWRATSAQLHHTAAARGCRPVPGVAVSTACRLNALAAGRSLHRYACLRSDPRLRAVLASRFRSIPMSAPRHPERQSRVRVGQPCRPEQRAQRVARLNRHRPVSVPAGRRPCALRPCSSLFRVTSPTSPAALSGGRATPFRVRRGMRHAWAAGRVLQAVAVDAVVALPQRPM